MLTYNIPPKHNSHRNEKKEQALSIAKTIFNIFATKPTHKSSIMSNMRTILSLIVFIIAECNLAFAQQNNADVFKLKKVDGHYVFNAQINQSVESRILVESGIHVMLIDSAFAFNHQEELHLNLVPHQSEQKMNLGGKRHRITHRAKGKIMLNERTTYEGKILILADLSSYYDMAVPVQNLHNATDNSRIVKLDMKNYTLQLIGKDEYLTECQSGKSFDINYDTYLKMPAIKAELTFKQDGRKFSLGGNFVLDLGNGSFIALMKQSQAVKDFVKENVGLKLQKGYNRKGDVVAEAIATQQAKLCGITFRDQIVVITAMLPKFTSEGNIGLKFFDRYVSIFNFDDSKFVIF